MRSRTSRSDSERLTRPIERTETARGAVPPLIGISVGRDLLQDDKCSWMTGKLYKEVQMLTARFRLAVLALALIMVAGIDVYAQSSLRLKLTDKKGNVVDISNPSIDYTRYTMFYKSDHESDGIRIKQGPGEVTVKWERIREVRFLRDTRGGDPFYIKAEMILTTGEVSKVEVLDPAVGGGSGGGGGRLKGNTSLGDFAADLSDLRSIAVVHRKPGI